MRTLPAARAPIWSCGGLVLADDVMAPHDVPPFANSAMDGFAVRHADLNDVPTTLRISEDVAAGHVATGSVEPGRAIKIMTGAPLPEGADTVVWLAAAREAGKVSGLLFLDREPHPTHLLARTRESAGERVKLLEMLRSYAARFRAGQDAGA